MSDSSNRTSPLWTKEDFADASNVPHGTLSDYAHWYGLLRKWNARINLVAPKEIDQFWRRHAYDSWQLNAHLPKKWSRLVDLGSGGGFPGLSFGILAKQNGAGEVHLVESVGKKTSFLKTVARDLKLPVTVHTDRVENLMPLNADVLTARAFAPLPRLFGYAHPHLAEGATLLLPKGETADKEIESAQQGWHFAHESFKSETDSAAAILRITDLRPK
ncbi:MAG: 16S rRNA (guanine(527)-N(7))-methyltransferase RsmG [Litorimonas sp.]